MKQLPFTKAVSNFANIVEAGMFSGRHQTHSADQVIKDILIALTRLREESKRVYLIGNGGSASVAAHICTDMLNVCRLHAQVLHEAAQMTCFCNDYGYASGYARQLEILGREGDLLVAISSSGQSDNIINAVNVARQHDMQVFTLTGFDASNPLRRLGDWNFWLESRAYGDVEIGHLFLLHYLCNQLD